LKQLAHRTQGNPCVDRPRAAGTIVGGEALHQDGRRRGIGGRDLEGKERSIEFLGTQASAGGGPVLGREFEVALPRPVGLEAAISRPGVLAAVSKTIPINRIATANEIAKPILWLLSDEASFVTSARLDVSGGGFVIPGFTTPP
jgi:hypothetical protein